MSSLKTILIIEDNAVNRLILNKILSPEYCILEAENGKEGLELLQKSKEVISAIILDLVMPVMNGYDFLKFVKGNADYYDLPIIVSTGSDNNEDEKYTLQLGAWDFISKPYDGDILKFRLKNAIERSQLTAFKQLKYIMEYDPLTGIYNKAKFFWETHKMLIMSHEETFAFIRMDIDRFQLVNSFYGRAEGDRLLKYVADKLRNIIKNQNKGTYGRMEADVFSICILYQGEHTLVELIENFELELKRYHLDFNLNLTCGIYVIGDNTENIDQMLDKANLAAKQMKGNYLKNIVIYNEELSRRIEVEQEIINDMSWALAHGEFQIYLQPKYNLRTNKPEGAEALVRWMHPHKGMISPEVFIPVFERNGFVSQLDYYVWEHVCILLRKWLDEEKPPLPISVNISRVNIYTPNLVEKFCTLTEKYQIPKELLQLELTESAYIDNPQIMMETIKKLQKEGFVILMDDFGSGYSSLNILKDVEVNILKLDMKFLSDTGIPGRGENIISSVVRMAKWLSIPVIAEGVEKLEQVEFLRGIGCEYVQGYYFAKPMCIEEYEKLAQSNVSFQAPKKEQFNADELWVSNPQMEMLFTNVLQAVAIYEFQDDHLEILRVNKAFYDLFGHEDISLGSKDPLDMVKSEYRAFVLNAFRQVVSEDTTECDYQHRMKDERKMWIHLKLKNINQVGGKHIIFGSFADITSQKEIDIELLKYRTIVRANRSESGKMLVVDDMEVNRDILKTIFRDRFTILEAENGQEALDILRQNQNYVDIIMLDLMMPVMDGTEFLDHKRASVELSEIPVIIITADETAERQINTLAMGANDYIVKPFVEEIVVRRVNNVLESNRRFRDILREYNTVAKQAQTDPLTGIYNRVIAEQLINHILINQTEYKHALIMLDIDNFKNINDTYGHASGDEVLAFLAQRLTMFFRKGDIISRFGGDEFCVFMTSVPNAKIVAEKCTALCHSIVNEQVSNMIEPLTISVGVALTEYDAYDFATLYQNADLALYDAKRLGKNQIALYGQNIINSAINQWISKESLIDTLDIAVLAIDDTNNNLLYCNSTAQRLLNIDDYQRKKCYEVLHGYKKQCPFCIKDKLSYETYYQWKYVSDVLGKKWISRDKLVELNGREIHLQLLMDMPSTLSDVTEGRKDKKYGE